MRNSAISNKFFVCGSVDDGKSTLLGRILVDTRNLPDDQIADIKNNSKKLCRITDGLKTEIDNNITVDVAYRYFNLFGEKYIFVDCPGHYEFTANMISGASQCDSAIILIDVCNGPVEQTFRHIDICRFLGIKLLIIAVNKMDKVDYSEQYFTDTINKFGKTIEDFEYHFVPVSAINGDNVVSKSKNMKWYKDDVLIDLLHSCFNNHTIENDFVFSTQFSIDGCETLACYGEIIHGHIEQYETVYNNNTGVSYTIDALLSDSYNTTYANLLDCCTLLFNHGAVIKRGDVLSRNKLPKQKKINVMLFVIDTNIAYLDNKVKLLNQEQSCMIKFDINVANLKAYSIYKATIYLNDKIVCMPYKKSRDLGRLIILDEENNTVAAGTII